MFVFAANKSNAFIEMRECDYFNKNVSSNTLIFLIYMKKP